jgi:hypothetical protein
LERREWVRSQLEIQPQLFEKNLRYSMQEKTIEETLERARGELKSMEAWLLVGDTPPVSASNLQETLQSFAAKDGVQVITTRVLNPEGVGPFTKIPIQVEISGQLEQIANLIRGLEDGQKLLVVNELNIRSLFVPATATRGASIPGASAQNLRASLVIAGFVRSQGPSTDGQRSPAKLNPKEGKTTGGNG